MARAPVLTISPQGLYCPAGGFHIDPWRPVNRALITHAHADHARAGHRTYLCATPCAPVLQHRLGRIAVDTIDYGTDLQIGDARVSFHPAGHVPGSAQIRVEVAGEVWVVSGDYKTEADGLSEAFEPVRCHCFITECTFGLPVFRWQPQATVAADLNQWWQDCIAAGQTAVIAAYSLGKAQRLLSMLYLSLGPVLAHGAVEDTTAVLRRQGYQLPQTVPLTPDTTAADHPGALLIAPPAALGSDRTRRFGPVSTGFASGWMQLRGIRRRRSADRGFVMSDHADWDGLNHAIRETGAERVLVTHGYTGAFARWLCEQGYDAAVLDTEFTGEPPDAEDSA